MTVKIRTRNGKLVADIIVRGPEGRVRERRNVPREITSPSGAQRWGEARARSLALHGQPKEVIAAPTLREFGPRWMKEYSRANGNKPSTLAAKDTILRLHLCPVLGHVRLDAIGDAEIQRLKLHLEGMAPKTRACVLSVLATLLKTAERWDEIAKAPRIEIGKWAEPTMEFYDFEEMEHLYRGAKRAGPMVCAAILLGGDAGLRRGEIVALEQSDVGGGAVTVRRSEWEGKIGTPKGGKARRIPLTARLQQAVEALRHLRGKRLLYGATGPVKVTTLQSWLEMACRRAGLPESRNLAPRHEGRARHGHQGVGRARRPEDDHALYAPESTRHRSHDPRVGAWYGRGASATRESAMRVRPHRDSNPERLHSVDSLPSEAQCTPLHARPEDCALDVEPVWSGP